MWLVVCTMWQMVGKWTAWSSSSSFLHSYIHISKYARAHATWPPRSHSGNSALRTERCAQ